VNWVLRDRPPLALQLYFADREHRLIRLGPSNVAIVEFPVAVQDQVSGRRAGTRWLRRLDSYWSVVAFLGPAAGLLAAAAAIALLGLLGHAGVTLLLAALVLACAAIVWVTAVMAIGLLAVLVRAWHSVERTPDSRAHAAGPLLSVHWAVSLFHAPVADVPALVAAIRSQITELVSRLPESARRDGSGTEIVLFLLDGVTSESAEQKLREMPDAVALSGTRPRLLGLGDAKAILPSKPASYPARGIFLFLGVSLLTVLIEAWVIADQERQSCGSGCPSGGLTSYGDALRYLLQRLLPFYGDDDLAPAGGWAWLLGWIVSVLGLTMIASVIVAIRRHMTFQRDGVDRAYDEIRRALDARRPTFGIVTAIPEEYAAVRVALDNPVEYTFDRDRSRYLLGTLPSVGGGPAHPVVVTLMLQAGNDLAAAASTNLARSFHTINCVIMSGIAAGVPRPGVPDKHVRLGDVVVATWGIVDFDHVDQRPEGVWLRNGMPQPSTLLGGTAKLLEAEERLGRRPWEAELKRIVDALPSYGRPDDTTDTLLARGEPPTVIPHPGRERSGHRAGQPKVHYGLIGSSDRSLRDAHVRDILADLYGLRALEMEGKGIGTASALAGVEWFVVRGISDYGDEFTTSTWRCYAAAAAAAYVRALLAETPSLDPRGGHVRGSS
jgi:nucleoside phosphorylase